MDVALKPIPIVEDSTANIRNPLSEAHVQVLEDTARLPREAPSDRTDVKATSISDQDSISDKSGSSCRARYQVCSILPNEMCNDFSIEVYM
jgi:hypothetical protein